MARHRRIIGPTGWNHIIVRGINRENLFYDETDYQKFISILSELHETNDFKVDAYCLMNNHVHLLMFSYTCKHSEIMKKLLIRYANYYNKKYDRVGHVFQDRYRSEAVDDARYFLTVTRYIYRNPEKSGICSARQYKYTYINKAGILSGFFDSDDSLYTFLDEKNEDTCLDHKLIHELNDTDALNLLVTVTGSKNPHKLQEFSREMRNNILRQLKEKHMTIRQISRLTGINRNIVQRA